MMHDEKSCPNDGAQAAHPVLIRTLRYFALLPACAGAILLLLYSVYRDVPLVEIRSIAPEMNFSCIQVQGDVTRDAWITASGGVMFFVNDGSGEIMIKGGRAQADRLQETGRLPKAGDIVTVAGAVYVNADQKVKLCMQSSENLTLKKKDPKPLPEISQTRVKDLSSDQKGRLVSVSGILKEIIFPAPGSRAPYICVLEEEGVKLDVVFWNQVFAGLNGRLPAPGKRICVRGRVGVYNRRLQVKVQDANDFTVVSGADLLKKDGRTIKGDAG